MKSPRCLRNAPSDRPECCKNQACMAGLPRSARSASQDQRIGFADGRIAPGRSLAAVITKPRRRHGAPSPALVEDEPVRCRVSFPRRTRPRRAFTDHHLEFVRVSRAEGDLIESSPTNGGEMRAIPWADFVKPPVDGRKAGDRAMGRRCGRYRNLTSLRGTCCRWHSIRAETADFNGGRTHPGHAVLELLWRSVSGPFRRS